MEACVGGSGGGVINSLTQLGTIQIGIIMEWQEIPLGTTVA